MAGILTDKFIVYWGRTKLIVKTDIIRKQSNLGAIVSFLARIIGISETLV